jgi:hypothetical protein
MTFSDEVLSSYLDGEAGPALCREIETAMADDPALAARMEQLGANDGLLRAAFDEALGETPERLTSALQARPSADILAFRPKPRSKPQSAIPWPKLAAASVVAIAVGATFALTALPRPVSLVGSAPDGSLVAGGKLASALASTPSGGQAVVGAARLNVALSFKSNDGRLCRQFRLASPQGGSDGVACRGKGGWRVEGWMSSSAAAAAGGYQMAGGPEASPITGVVDRLGVAQTLDRGAEANAIRSGWK